MKIPNIITATAFLILVITLYKCSGCNPSYNAETKIIHDTSYIKVKDSTGFYQPAFTVIQGARIPDGIDTVKVIETHFQKVYVSDSVKTKFGFIRIHDSLWQNRIIARQVFTDFSLPVYTNTILIPEKKRNQVYFGLGGAGGPGLPMSVGPSLMFKSKSGHVLEVGGMLNSRGQWSVNGSLKFLIHLKK
jgi:hypothetical protein